MTVPSYWYDYEYFRYSCNDCVNIRISISILISTVVQYGHCDCVTHGPLPSVRVVIAFFMPGSV